MEGGEPEGSRSFFTDSAFLLISLILLVAEGMERVTSSRLAELADLAVAWYFWNQVAALMLSV